MIIVYILLLLLLILFVSKSLGGLLCRKFKLDELLPLELIGYLIWISIFFLVSQFIDINNISSDRLFQIFLITTVIILLCSVCFFRINWNLRYFGFVIIYVFCLVLISFRYTLGEQLGDNTFLFTLVTKNVNSPLINNFEFGSGFTYNSSAITKSKDSLTFYHFSSFIIHYFFKIKNWLGLQQVPSYVLNMWISNILFYFFSSTIVISVIRIFKMKPWTSLLVVIFSGFFIGSIYYNVTLPHFGVTYLGLGVSAYLLLVWQYLVSKSKFYIGTLFFVIFALNSMASTGMIMSSYLLFGFITVLIIRKDENALLYAGLLLIPIAVFANQVKELITVTYLIPTIWSISILLIVTNYIELVRNFIYRNFIAILVSSWILFIIISIIIVPDYFNEIVHFFDSKENFDRVRDYFSFTNRYQSLLNIFHYVLLISIVLNKKTRDFGLIFIIIIFFFINPLSYPLLFRYTQWLYHRSYFVLFNITSLSIGIYALMNILKNVKITLRLFIKVLISALIMFFTYTNVTTYENVIYIPADDFNPIYKLENDQVDILFKLNEEVERSGLVNAKVISQIYGTLMLAPDIYHYLFTVSDRRAWDPNQKKSFSELYQMMFTPVFEGDDGPRLEMNYWRLCHVLEQEPVRPEYLLFDNSLTTLDDVSNSWLPIHWFARGCATNIYENESYTLYRYTGNVGVSE